MPTYMEKDVLSPRELRLFNNVQRVTEMLLQEPKASCHSICKGISDLFPKYFAWKQGYFGEFHQHSWLRFIEQPMMRDRFIIDPYPVGAAGGAIIVDINPTTIIPLPWKTLYREADLTDVIPDNQKDQLV